jgi:hypothetical protein
VSTIEMHAGTLKPSSNVSATDRLSRGPCVTNVAGPRTQEGPQDAAGVAAGTVLGVGVGGEGVGVGDGVGAAVAVGDGACVSVAAGVEVGAG